jgi:predicted phage terminase large subunit-like protein
MAEHLEAVTRGHIRKLLINIPPRHMKQIADSTPIMTPIGWRRHGDIGVGDYVFGRDGQPTRVVAITDKTIADYEVEITGDETIKCNGDHLWTVWDRWSRTWKTLDTTTLAGMQTEPYRNRFFLPDAAPVQFDAAPPLPIHPYFLGCWLGDGCSHDEDDSAHIAKLELLGYAVSAVWKNGGKGVQSNFGRQGLMDELRRLGVIGNKHIPDVYLTASDGDRLELLAGIIDTDGHVERQSSRVRISTCDKALADQIHSVAVSLGFRPYIVSADAPGYGAYTANHETVYQVGFQPDRAIPTALARKQINRLDFERRRRAIKSIRRAAVVEQGHCITVDRRDGLYLVGKTNVVTHNSLMVGVAWPAWTWIQDPESGPLAGPGVDFLFTAYAQALTIRDGLKSRRLIRSRWFREQWADRFALLSDQNTKIRFENDQKGQRINSSVQGGVTGEGGDVIVFDDPHNVVDGESDIQREAVLTWWDEAMQTRINNPRSGAFVGVMQRIHARDLSGHILENDHAHDWTHVCLPARFERDHPNRWWRDPRKQEGELLWPARMPEAELNRLEAAMNVYAVAGQLQQRPGPRGGGMFKRINFEIVRGAPPMTKMVRAWDIAATAQRGGNDPDWTRGALMGISREGVYYILDMVGWRVGPGDVENNIKKTAQQDGMNTWVHFPQDPGAGGKILAASLVKAVAGYMVRAEPVGAAVKGSKEMRATPLASQVEVGNVKLLAGDWNEAFLAELAAFPTGAHDDQVDAAADGFNFLAGVVSGEGLIEFYRREAEKAAMRDLGPDELPPIADDDMVVIIPAPGGPQAAYGLSGEFYRAGPDGKMRVRPEDAGPLITGSPGWRRE